jgi:putative Mg2+ transporter-C (MgtC) family protein
MTYLLETAGDLGLAWLAGSLIGLERTYNGRVAGFRTHGLVALAAAATMSIAAAPLLTTSPYPQPQAMLEPTRLAQGVMTGVGFLGAGVIFKEGVSIQGLTTAASIWVTSAIGLMLGIGLVWPGMMATAAVLVTLTLLRHVEAALPSRVIALGVFRFRAETAPTATEIESVLCGEGVTLDDVSYRLVDEGRVFEFQGNVTARRRSGFGVIAERLKALPGLVEFQLNRVSK